MERDTHRLCVDQPRLTKPPWTIESLKLLRKHFLRNRLKRRPNGTVIKDKQERISRLNQQGQANQLNKQEQDNSLSKQ